MTAYNRGQVLYRVAEMLEARATDLAEVCSGAAEVEEAVDRMVWYAGWTDKLPQVLGGANPVAGPYFNFTVPEPTGVVGIVAPAEPALLGLVSRLAPVLAGGNTCVVIASEAHPRAAIELAEVLATSDVPGGVVNLLTGRRDELAPHLASHLDVDALDLAARRRRARARRGRQRQARRLLQAGPEPLRDLELPRAQDGLAPDGPVGSWPWRSQSSRSPATSRRPTSSCTEDLVVGEGEEARAGSIVEVHYVGVSWKNGREFDASWDRGDTFKFTARQAPGDPGLGPGRGRHARRRPPAAGDPARRSPTASAAPAA